MRGEVMEKMFGDNGRGYVRIYLSVLYEKYFSVFFFVVI